jgi:transposase
LKRVDTIARVRRAFYVQGWSVKRIVRELYVSRNTVRKILRSDETEFSYERERQPMPRIGPWQEKLDELLLGNANKPSRERLTLIRIYEELRAMGYAGGYDAVRRYARSWSKFRGAMTAEAYVPLYYGPGEAYQFDWSHEVVLIARVTVTVKMAHVRLCHSRMMFVRAYILARRRDPSPQPLLLTPTALRLTHEPVADCARYDSLRRPSRHGPHTHPRPDGNAEALRDAQRL